ncbi:MAG: hypothetical protein BYD32DRAFT_455710 [Podila humilis]|nr:MAG: hypothetical protein BYD32DRAFT_455710 [Podila humilis]
MVTARIRLSIPFIALAIIVFLLGLAASTPSNRIKKSGERIKSQWENLHNICRQQNVAEETWDTINATIQAQYIVRHVDEVEVKKPLASIIKKWKDAKDLALSRITGEQRAPVEKCFKVYEDNAMKALKASLRKRCSYEQIYRTMGLISADGSNKVTSQCTLTLTTRLHTGDIQIGPLSEYK